MALWFLSAVYQCCMTAGSIHWLSIYFWGVWLYPCSFLVLEIAASRLRWTLNWWSQKKLPCRQVTKIPSAPTLEALSSVPSQDLLALLLAWWGKMLSAVFLIAAEFLLLHGWLVFEMLAERGKKLITLNAQSVSNTLSLRKDFCGNCSTDAEDCLGGAPGSSLMSVGFLLPVAYMRLTGERQELNLGYFASSFVWWRSTRKLRSGCSIIPFNCSSKKSFLLWCSVFSIPGWRVLVLDCLCPPQCPGALAGRCCQWCLQFYSQCKWLIP